MTGWLDDYVAALDTESTGLDTETDRIITACIGGSWGPGDWEPGEWRINPGVPIPEAASAVHGIRDADVTDWDAPADALHGIWTELSDYADDDVPIIGFNLAYDMTLLDREFRRHLRRRMPDGLIVLDVLVLWRRLERETGSRRLSQLAERHGIIFPAHDATADALATLRLLHILADRHDFLTHIPARDLHDLQAAWYAAQQDTAHQARLGRGDHADPPDTSWPLRPYREDTPNA